MVLWDPKCLNGKKGISEDYALFNQHPQLHISLVRGLDVTGVEGFGWGK
jgi:hypothetical protein